MYRNVPRVRIPNSPPKKSEKSRFFGLFFFARLLKIGTKLWKEQPVFWKEQGDFGYFGIFEPLKSVLSAIVWDFAPLAAKIHRFGKCHSADHCLCRRQFWSVVKVGINVSGCGKIAVSQPFLNLFQRYAVRKKQTSAPRGRCRHPSISWRYCGRCGALRLSAADSCHPAASCESVCKFPL